MQWYNRECLFWPLWRRAAFVNANWPIKMNKRSIQWLYLWIHERALEARAESLGVQEQSREQVHMGCSKAFSLLIFEKRKKKYMQYEDKSSWKIIEKKYLIWSHKSCKNSSRGTLWSLTFSNLVVLTCFLTCRRDELSNPYHVILFPYPENSQNGGSKTVFFSEFALSQQFMRARNTTSVTVGYQISTRRLKTHFNST